MKFWTFIIQWKWLHFQWSWFSGCFIEEGVDYVGNDIDGQGSNLAGNVENKQDCAKLSHEKEAKFWTYDRDKKYCWLKTSNEGREVLTPVVSGNSECGIEGGNAGCSIEKWVDYVGNDIDINGQGPNRFRTEVENQEDCAKLSLGKGAKFWTYDPDEKYCYLKTSNKGRKALTPPAVSGNSECGIEGRNAENSPVSVNNINKAVKSNLSIFSKALEWMLFWCSWQGLLEPSWYCHCHFYFWRKLRFEIQEDRQSGSSGASSVCWKVWTQTKVLNPNTILS